MLIGFRKLTPDVSVSSQLDEAGIEDAAGQGCLSIICNRPDGEAAGQPAAGPMSRAAARHGMAFEHMPVVPGRIGDADVARMAEALGGLDAPHGTGGTNIVTVSDA